MNKISYCLTCCTERQEVEILLNQLKYIRPIDEIIVLFDEKNGSKEVHEFLLEQDNITLIVSDEFNNDFATWKNKLFSYVCDDCTHILFLDSDELPHRLLLEYLPDIIDGNPDVELFWIPRINLVRGIGLSHVKQWGWNISKLDNYISKKSFDLSNKMDNDEYCLLKEYNLIFKQSPTSTYEVEYYLPIINKFDYQGRLCKNKPSLRWYGSVHETIQGAKIYSKLPEDEFISLIHDKQIDKQVSQNTLYNKI